MNNTTVLPHQIPFKAFIGQACREETPAPLPGAAWYTLSATFEGLEYSFPVGALASAQYLTADFLLDGSHLAVFNLTLQEGENGPAFGLSFGLLNQCQARLRMPLEAVNQNRWRPGLHRVFLDERTDLGICTGDPCSRNAF